MKTIVAELFSQASHLKNNPSKYFPNPTGRIHGVSLPPSPILGGPRNFLTFFKEGELKILGVSLMILLIKLSLDATNYMSINI